jgi:plastocyanin
MFVPSRLRRMAGAAVLMLAVAAGSATVTIAAGPAVMPVTAAPSEPAVHIDNFAFVPATLTVQRGTKVVFTNRDDIPHTVTSAATPPSFKSPPLDTGDAYSYVFDKTGTFAYFCSLHPHMQGKIVVK